jgi:hypothetical protein
MELNNLSNKHGSRVKTTVALLTSIALMSFTGCSSEPVELGAPNVSFYVLDLTGSGDVDSQFKRIETELNRSINEGPFGNPFGDEDKNTGPETLRFNFIGTNSRFLESFELVDVSKVYSLFEEASKDNRKKENWDELKKFYQKFINNNQMSAEEKLSDSQCRDYYNREMSDFFSAQSTRDFYASSLCDIAVSNLKVLEDLKKYIETQKGNQEASDVFGALQVVEREANSVLNSFPKAKVKVFLATDGDHNYGKNQPDNLKNRISNSSDVCQLAEEIATELNVETLRSQKVQLTTEGLGALKNGVGRYPAQLDSFWRCFFNE